MFSSPTTKKKEQSPKSNPNPSLPDDLIVSILARISRSYYTKLSLVSKSFRSILASPEIYQTRTLLGYTETFLYVCLRFPDEPNPRWFTLYRKPNQTLIEKKTKEKDSCVNLLAPTPILNSPPVEWSSLVAVGSNLYAITAYIEYSPPCFNVWYLDCQNHTWLESPRMRLAHTNCEVDGMVYLAGSSRSPDSLNFVEVYDTRTRTWNTVPHRKQIFKRENMEGKIYLKLKKALYAYVLNPKVLTWEALELGTYSDRSVCTIDNTVYLYDPSGLLKRRSNFTEGAVWKTLGGLEGLPNFADCITVKLADHGGKLVVLWDKYVSARGYVEKMIWS